MRMTHGLRTLMLGVVVFGGCGKDSEGTATTKTSPGEDSDSASSTGTPGTGTSATGVDPTAPTTSNGTTTSGAPTSTGCMFLDCTGTDTVADKPQCDIWNEDCPEGQKCMPWDSMNGADTWNSTTCSPVNANPGQKGDECTVEGSSTSGIDSCDKHLLCWYLNDMNVGTCISMCEGVRGRADLPGRRQVRRLEQRLADPVPEDL